MRGICKIALRILAIYFFIISLSYLENIIFVISNPSLNISPDNQIQSMLVVSILFFLTRITFCILLWVFAERISNKIVNDDIPLKTELSYDIILKTAFIVIGIFLLATSIPHILSEYYQYQELSRIGHDVSVVRSRASLINDFLKIIVGCVLIFGFKKNRFNKMLTLADSKSVTELQEDEQPLP